MLLTKLAISDSTLALADYDNIRVSDVTTLLYCIYYDYVVVQRRGSGFKYVIMINNLSPMSNIY